MWQHGREGSIEFQVQSVKNNGKTSTSNCSNGHLISKIFIICQSNPDNIFCSFMSLLYQSYLGLKENRAHSQHLLHKHFLGTENWTAWPEATLCTIQNAGAIVQLSHFYMGRAGNWRKSCLCFCFSMRFAGCIWTWQVFIKQQHSWGTWRVMVSAALYKCVPFEGLGLDHTAAIATLVVFTHRNTHMGREREREF